MESTGFEGEGIIHFFTFDYFLSSETNGGEMMFDDAKVMVLDNQKSFGYY